MGCFWSCYLGVESVVTMEKNIEQRRTVKTGGMTTFVRRIVEYEPHALDAVQIAPVLTVVAVVGVHFAYLTVRLIGIF